MPHNDEEQFILKFTAIDTRTGSLINIKQQVVRTPNDIYQEFILFQDILYDLTRKGYDSIKLVDVLDTYGMTVIKG